MAKKSVIERNYKRQRIVRKYAERRAALKAILRDPRVSDEQRWEAQQALQKLPRNASPTRLRNRCHFTGRGQSVYRKFGLARNKLREAAMEGNVPGLVKASW